MEPRYPGVFYHLYNRGNNRENLFVEDRNFDYFLQLFAKYIEPAANTYAYCLLPNHFHFLVQIKEQTDLTGIQRPVRSHNPSQTFSNLFNAYARAFNIANQRSGALFQRPFHRIPVTTNAYLTQVILYIHQNPQRHGLIGVFRKWHWSSYPAMIHTGITRLKRAEVLALFGGFNGFIKRHADIPDLSGIKEIGDLDSI